MRIKQLVMSTLDNTFSPLIKMIVTQVISIAFKRLMDTNPKEGKVAVVSLYPVVDGILEDLAEKTPDDWDNAVVDGIKSGLENVAESYGFELPNVDAD